MKLIISALFIATINVFAQEPPVARLEDKPELLSITTTMPKSPATLSTGEKFTVTVRYTNPAANSVQIFARPYTKGKPTPGYGAHPSAAYPKGTGEVEGWFYFSSATSVDEIRVRMIDPKTREEIAAVKLPVQLTWERPAGAPPATPTRAVDGVSPLRRAAGTGGAGFLAIGNSYLLRFPENGRVLPGFLYNHPVKLIAAAPGGWYRIEYSAHGRHETGATKAPEPVKIQTWLNFAYVAAVEEATSASEAKPQ